MTTNTANADGATTTRLLIAVRLPDGRYHGTGDHPPAPARLFQALVAGIGLGGPAELERASGVLSWLEGLTAPVVAAPHMTRGQRLKNYVPNNDLDAKGGDPRRVGEIRVQKIIQPWLFDAEIPLLYAWDLRDRDHSSDMAQAACVLARTLYQFGRGVDLAWAWGELLDEAAFEDRLYAYPGRIFRPSYGDTSARLSCPTRGSLERLRTRFASGTRRLQSSSDGKQHFTQQPKPRFVLVAYDSPGSRHVFELQSTRAPNSLGAWPLARACAMVTMLRDGAVARLDDALPASRSETRRFLVGRKPDGADAAPTASRVRIVPLPSIGHEYADRGIRRILVEVPGSCPLRGEDVRWAFSGLDVIEPDTGEVRNIVLAPAADDSMLAHYGAKGERFRTWRTVTPAALPEAAKRRRIDPVRLREEAKGGRERTAEETRAAGAVRQALRHAQINAGVDTIRLQRESFEGRGERVEAFAAGTRFGSHRLWHVEVVFREPIGGPLIIGDGRFLGLGLLAPLKQHLEVHVFGIAQGLSNRVDPIGVSRALRRAVIARAQDVIGEREVLPTFFTGHEQDGRPADGTGHLAFAFDPARSRLLIVAPHLLERRAPTWRERRHLATLERAMTGFHTLRAGSAGLLSLVPMSLLDDVDPLFAPSRTWETETVYHVTRHVKMPDVAAALEANIMMEARRRGLPEARVTVLDCHGIPGVGLVGRARLDFGVAVAGPVMLGRMRFLGGGLFARRSP